MKSTTALLCCAFLTAFVPLSHAGTLTDKLEGRLVQLQDGKVKKVPKGSLSNTKVLAFYYSAHWCPPCRQFTPTLADTYKKLKAAHPEFELVFVSSDRSEGEMEEYLKWGNMIYPAVDFKDIERLKEVQALSASGIPYMVVVDADGKELAGKGKEDWVHPSRIVPRLEKILAGN